MSRAKEIKAPKGFSDILPSESWKWQFVEQCARTTAALFHFSEIRTPLIESSDLFHRGVGETTDIVTKETFNIEPRKEDSDKLSLRPEQTAGVVRAMIENGAFNDQGARAKVFYIGPNFRFERPQKGRLRQHHQFGIEAFGVAEPEQDVECILLQLDFYQRCGVKDMSLRINSLGDAESKQRYRDVLVKFFSPKIATMSEDSQRRLQTNPLRILDSKDPRDVEAVKNAPSAGESLSEKSKSHFARVTQLLKDAGVEFKIDGTLVRGFDYYTDTLWEITAGGLGAQNALGGGGRYDNLVEQLGGRPTAGVGFGSGIERLLIALDEQKVEIPREKNPLVWLIAHGSAAREENLKLLNLLRNAGIATDMDLGNRSVKSQFKLADREGATISLITGDDELAAKTVQMKDLSTGEQKSVARDQIVNVLSAALTGKAHEVH